MESSVLAVVTNYDFSENADSLKARLAQHFETLLVDSGSPTRPRTADIVVPNLFYSGLWNEAVRLAVENRKQWLLFVASDVHIPDTDLLASCIRDVLKRSSAGIYTPSLRPDSRSAYPACFCRCSGRIRECFVCEGFFFLARTKILSKLYPIDSQLNLYGWGVDVMSSCRAYQMGYHVLADDRVTIYHPSAIHTIESGQARQDGLRYIAGAGNRFLGWTTKRLNRENDGREIPRRLALRVSQLARRSAYAVLDRFSRVKAPRAVERQRSIGDAGKI